jgi:ABC-type branched-subunit amino acid transport system ATPase component
MTLRIDNIDCYYGHVQVLRGVSLDLAPGEVLCLLGRNGAGKTTALKAIMGLVRPRAGRVMLDDTDLTALPAHEVPRRGIAYVPQGRRLFAELTVEENLTLGLMTRNHVRNPRPLLCIPGAARNGSARVHCPRRAGDAAVAGALSRTEECCCWTSRPKADRR